mmetsp:Transcript_13788/g.15985  ORF Transcript_13788/g.15985 Transcript_13788/m.15985 type:complete len:184 (+) Transcript_13788:3-554(+)
MKAILLLILVAFAMAKLEFMSEVSRHGARASGTVYNFTVDPAENFDIPMELSNFGMRQHYLIGTHVRKRYIDEEKLISPVYNSSEILFKTTDRTRTYESGMSQISGIFPPRICSQVLTKWQQDHAAPPVDFKQMDSVKNLLKDKALPDCYNVLPIISKMNDHSYDLEPQDTDCQAYKQVSDEL